MRADLKKQLKFPEEIAHTNLRPDIVLWSRGTKQVVLIELTVPWEERIEEAQAQEISSPNPGEPAKWIEGLEVAGGGGLQGFGWAVTLESPRTAGDQRAG